MDNQSEGSGHTRAVGDLDRKFGTVGSIQFEDRGTVTTIVHDKDDKLVFALQVGKSFILTRYLRDGIEDAEFRNIEWNFRDGDRSYPTRVLIQDDEKILLVGASKTDTGEWNPVVVRFLSNGGHDIVFGRRVLGEPDRAATWPANDKYVDGCLQKDQKILICANFLVNSNEENPEDTLSRLFRLQPNGELDTDFGEGRGYIDIRLHDHASYACDVQVQSDGKIIVAGSWRRPDETPRTRTVARYTQTGQLDLTFGSDGYADIVVEEETGLLLPAERYLPDIVTRLLVQDDDKILITGYAKAPSDLESGLLVRLEATGGMDGSFNNGEPLLISRTSSKVHLQSMTLQSDGKIVVVGSAFMANTNWWHYERVAQNGQVEDFFQSPGIFDLADVTVQQVGGRVVMAGSFGNQGSGIFPHVWGIIGR